MKIEEGDTVAIECQEKHSHPGCDAVAKRKPRFRKMKNKIKILNPNWDRPENDEAAWLAGDV